MDKDEIPVLCAEEPVNISNLFKKQVSLHSSQPSSFTLCVIRDEFFSLREHRKPSIMSGVGDSSLEWTLAFEPDEDTEEELAGEEEPIGKALITDDTIRKCRIIASVRSIEYGEIEIAPGQTKAGSTARHQLRFSHPFESRVKEADVEPAFNNKVTIAVLQPESIDDSESEETIRHKLYGEPSIGYPPAGVNAKAGSERETEQKKKFASRTRGLGNNTERSKMPTFWCFFGGWPKRVAGQSRGPLRLALRHYSRGEGVKGSRFVEFHFATGSSFGSPIAAA
jgi:hypothetical protein